MVKWLAPRWALVGCRGEIMLNRSDEHREATGQSLSALMDGQATAADAAALCAQWRGDEQVRERWAAYHLIGDVLRSEDLALPPERDEAFLQSLRQRLAAEPVVLAPRPARPSRPHRLGWQVATGAAAAGFVLVAGVMVMSRSGTDSGAPTLARDNTPELTLASGRVIRDAQLDRYLAAHKRVANGVAVGMPGAVVRSVDAIAIDDK